MTVVDLVFHLTEEILPSIVPPAVVAGAALLWRRTRRASTLVQLVGAILILAYWIFLRMSLFLMGAGILSSAPIFIPAVDVATRYITLASAIAFSVGYFCYALRPKSI